MLNYWAGNTLLGGLDLRLASSLNTPTVMTFCGSEVRSIRQAAKRSEFLSPDEWPREPRDSEYLTKLNDSLDLAIYQYHELEPYVTRHFDRVAHVPRAVDCEEITPQQPKDDGVFRVAHAPSDRQLKGTKYVIEAIESLRDTGRDIQLVEIEGQHDEVINILQRSDLVVDQLLLGTFGVVSLEAMAAGTPSICYMRDDLQEKYPDTLPVVNATPNNVGEVIKELSEDSDRRAALGKQGREYVTTHHSLPKVGERLLDVYRTIT
ncbi:glycosyltransferase [Halosegnis rubeus]|uniref:Glycosyltransferase n=1 Tax=Halosegnis rubeus TaxID=2212850 RepID=A0A5N5U846_9EURY|nr:glycosyltransferase [Halosegnis rubeus]KAB7514668.1 glycosyltransferase [Halosegnis rubeus]